MFLVDGLATYSADGVLVRRWAITLAGQVEAGASATMASVVASWQRSCASEVNVNSAQQRTGSKLEQAPSFSVARLKLTEQ